MRPVDMDGFVADEEADATDRSTDPRGGRCIQGNADGEWTASAARQEHARSARSDRPYHDAPRARDMHANGVDGEQDHPRSRSRSALAQRWNASNSVNR